MDYLGKSPIFAPALILGKIALFGCAFFVLAPWLGLPGMLYDSLATRVAGLALYAFGLALLLAGIAGLGNSIAVGIPARETELKTGGLYRYTRNPIYLGAFTLCAGSCLYSIHPLNFALFALAVAIHHRIVMKEEKFLAERFGRQWADYCDRVPRYLGLPKRQRGLVVHRSLFIQAPAAEVWRALTAPELIKQYLFGTEADSDWKPGSPIRYRGVWQGKAYEDKGTVVRAVPGRVLVTTYWSSLSGRPDLPENYATVTYQLLPRDNGTELTLRQDNNPSEEIRNHSEENWGIVLEGLKKLVERR